MEEEACGPALFTVYCLREDTLSVTYLSVGESQHRGQLLSVWLRHVFLNLKPLLQAFPLQIGKDRAGPGALPLVRLRHGVLGEHSIGTCQPAGREREVQGLVSVRAAASGSRGYLKVF